TGGDGRRELAARFGRGRRNLHLCLPAEGVTTMDERTLASPRPTAASVLVVDDDVILGEALGQLLLQKGLDVVGMADSGPDAVSLSRENEPDVVLMDFRMPMMDGL